MEGLKDVLARRMATEANVRVRLEAELMLLANGWTVVSTISSCCHSHVMDVVSTLLVNIVWQMYGSYIVK